LEQAWILSRALTAIGDKLALLEPPPSGCGVVHQTLAAHSDALERMVASLEERAQTFRAQAHQLQTDFCARYGSLLQRSRVSTQLVLNRHEVGSDMLDMPDPSSPTADNSECTDSLVEATEEILSALDIISGTITFCESLTAPANKSKPRAARRGVVLPAHVAKPLPQLNLASVLDAVNRIHAAVAATAT